MQTFEFKENLERLVQIGNEKRTTIICAEAVPWRCHRSLIDDALLARGFQVEDIYRVQEKRVTRNTHQFLKFQKEVLTLVPCSKGWMSPEGYIRYLKVTLEKMKQRK